MDQEIWRILVSVFLLVLSIVAGNFLRIIVRRLLEKRTTVRNAKIAARVSEYLVFSLGLYVIYSVIGLDLQAYAASLGILSIAIAFSSQQIIQNLVAGIIISIERPIELEDWVDIGAGINQTGVSRVRDINLMRTVLRDREGRLIYLPNSLLMTSRIFNYTKSGFIEVPINVRVALSADREKISRILLETAKEDPEVLPEVASKSKSEVAKLLRLPSIQRLFENRVDMSIFEPKILVSDVSDMGATLSLRVWIKDANRRDDISSRLLSSFLSKLKERGIDLK